MHVSMIVHFPGHPLHGEPVVKIREDAHCATIEVTRRRGYYDPGDRTRFRHEDLVMRED